MEEEMMRESLVKELERGKELTMQMRKLIDDNNGGYCLKTKGQLDSHSLEILTSFSSALSMLQTCFPFSAHQNLKSPTPTLTPTPHNNIVKFQEFAPKDGRGCYKRRKTNQQSLEIETSNVKDGHAWKKYGQKPIQNTHHPRHYYRCGYKNEQRCQATKQVQLIYENPPMYKIIYHGHHTCNNSFQNPPVYFDTIIDKQENSSFLLSFESPNNSKHGANPFMFSSPSSSTTPTSSSSLGSSVSNPRDEQENNNPIKVDEIPLEPSDYNHGSPSSSDLFPATSDLTTAGTAAVGLPSTPVFDDVISLPEIYSSVVSPHQVEEDYNCMIFDSFDFSQVSLDDDYLWGS